MWFISKDKMHFYITYNCELEDCKVEREIVDQIISTLK